MGFRIKEEHIWTPGSSAVSKDFELSKDPIHAVVINFDALGNSGAATIGNMKTQCGTYVYLKDGGTIITPKWSLTELSEYQELFFGKNVPFQDGTAANNVLALLQTIIPLGRPMGTMHNGFPIGLLDPHVGWNPKNTPYLHIEVPADGNSIDTRHAKICIVYNDTPFRYTKKWTEWSSQTVSTTGLTDWTIGDKGLWLEALLFETSEYNATLASDIASILDWRVERGSKHVITDGDIPNIIGATLDDDTHSDDIYKYIVLSQAPFDNFSNCLRLTKETKFRVLGGTADAVKAAFSVIS